LLIANDKGGKGPRETGAGGPQAQTHRYTESSRWKTMAVVEASLRGLPELGKCLANLNLNQCKSFWPNRSQLFK